MQEIKELARELYEKSANLTSEQYDEVRTNSENNITPEMRNDPIVMKIYTEIFDGMKTLINRMGGGSLNG